jgi:hypothetical protein
MACFSAKVRVVAVVGFVGLAAACGGGDDAQSGDGDGDGTGSGGTATGGSSGSSGGSSSGACGTPDLASQMVPCAGTQAEVPSQTEDFSVTGPFAAGATVAVVGRASSGLGMDVRAYSEPAACDDSMTLIGEFVIPNADETCVEVTLPEAAESVRFQFEQDTASYARLMAVCGQCP